MVTHLSAGALSGLVSSVALQPFDLLKTRIQQSKNPGSLYSQITAVLRQQGLWGLWRGAWPSTIRTSVGSALYFETLSLMRRDKNTALVNLVTGACARAVVGFAMMPITIVKVRFESSLYKYNSILHATRDILYSQGVRGLFAGFGATALRDAPFAGLYVLAYEACKKTLPGNSLPVNFASGIVAGCWATVITNPFDLVKTRIQTRPAEYVNLQNSTRKIFKEEGLHGFMDGVGLRMARKAASSAITWTLYEELVRQWKSKH